MGDITLKFDKLSGLPMFEQLYAHIRTEIMGGHLRRNDKLPSKRRLAGSLQCSQNTVQAAYNQLVDEGYLKAVPKSGYFVAATDDILSMQEDGTPVVQTRKQTVAYAYDFSHQGVDFTCFPFDVWKRLTRDVLGESPRELLQTGHPQGLPELRESVARYLHQSRGVNCVPDRILISSGTEFLLQLLIQLLAPDAVYALENPGFEKLPMIFHANRVHVVPIPLDGDGMRPDALEACVADVACIAPSHQFPTGSIMPVVRRIRMLQWAYERPERYIVEDDYDSEFRYSGRPIPSLQGLDQRDKVIYIGAFSKSISPALRVSYMVLPETLMARYRETLNFYICPVPTIEQKVLRLFMEKGHFERHLNRVRVLYRKKREALVAAIREQLPACTLQGASAGLHCTLQVHNGMNERELIDAATRKGVKVYGLPRYDGFPFAGKEGTLLIGFATMEIGDIPEAVGRLRQAWFP